ncbi:hypothetical protein ATO6_08080 [Oceanicola sp. 22II-s10i]|uniref:hypothetical protein n=1 Tax=Oceanicola sp. 22II-s10i TaxID=1317116 RepID=UPI000B521F94|nr:hypothetical protein [Oceanicola sp. 22II-s10i]OWU85017.1 hypothetical protein ATO6_08080 [Oceanicola sp. 22II-s10i]
MRILPALFAAFSFISTPAIAQDPQQVSAEIAAFEQLAEVAAAGTDPAVRLQRSNEISLFLVTVHGKPVFAFRRESNWRFGDQLGFSFDCVGEGKVRITYLMSMYMQKPLAPEIKAGFKGELRVKAKLRTGKSIDMMLKDAMILHEVEELESGTPHRRQFRVAVVVPANGKLFSSLRTTGNLQATLMKNDQYMNLSGGAGLEGYDADLKPMIQHCRTTDPGYVPPPPSPEDLADKEPVRLAMGPTPNQAEAAILRNFRARLAVFSGLLGLTEMEIRSKGGFTLHECHITTSSNAYCRYRANFELAGAGNNLAILIANLGFAINTSQWAAFDVVRNRWELRKLFDSCTIGDDEVRCETRTKIPAR